jgi:Uma2 family endonuclease
VREYWLVHPGDRVLTIYRLDAGKYGKPDIQELSGTTTCGILPEVIVDWAIATRRL